MRRTSMWTVVALATFALPAPVSASVDPPTAPSTTSESPPGNVDLTASVECEADMHWVNFVATVTAPTGGNYVVTPLFGTGFGPFSDSLPFTHTVGPMVDSPVSWGPFSFDVTRPNNPYDSEQWFWQSVPARGCSEGDPSTRLDVLRSAR